MSVESKGTISSEWVIFKSFVLPEGASEAQVRDMKNAFYAGALVASGDFTSGMVTDGEAEMAKAIEGILSVAVECSVFFGDRAKDNE